MRRDAIVEVIEVKPIAITDVPEFQADSEENEAPQPSSRPQPVRA